MDPQAITEMIRQMALGNGMSMTQMAKLVSDAAELNETMPTVGEFFARVEEVDGGKAGWTSRKGLHLLLVDAFGERRLDQVRPGDIEALGVARRNAVTEREDARLDKLAEAGLTGSPHRNGRGAQRNLIAAARRFFAIAVDDKLIVSNPALAVELPERSAPTARSLKPQQIDQLWDVAIGGGDDPELDGLLVWFHLETGARRGGAIGLRRRDLKQTTCTVVLTEKGKHGKRTREQPVSRELMAALDAHSLARGDGKSASPVFYYKDSTAEKPHPLKKKRYENLIKRIRLELPWANERWMKLHDLRRTGVTMIERISGSPAIARLFAGQTTGTALDTYDAADEDELRAALAEYLGRPVGHDAVGAE